MSHENIQTKHQAFEFGKSKLAAIFNHSDFTADTYTQYITDIESYMTYLKATIALPLESITETTYTSEHTETESEQPLEDDRLIGVFQKNLSGGIIQNDDWAADGPVFIGESWVREHNITQGDLVEVFDYHNNRASGVQVVERREPKTHHDIKEFKFGIVDDVYDAGSTEPLDMHRPFIIKKSVEGHVLDETYRLTTEEIDRLNIEKGDILDLAWYDNNPSTRKVIWKHQTDYDTSATVEQKILNSPEEKETVEQPATESVFTDNQFEGLTICLVGMDMYKDKFRKAVEERAGSFIHVDPKASRVRREAEYLKADIIMLGLQQISHESRNHAVAFAKQENIVYGSFNGHGTGPFILEIISKLQHVFSTL